MPQPSNPIQPPERPQTALSAENIRVLSERFGSSRRYPDSFAGITDERMRQLAEHFTP